MDDNMQEHQHLSRTLDELTMEETDAQSPRFSKGPHSQTSPRNLIHFPKKIERRSSSTGCCRRRVKINQSRNKSRSQQSLCEPSEDDIISFIPTSSGSRQGLDILIGDALPLKYSTYQPSVYSPLDSKLARKAPGIEMATQHSQPSQKSVNFEHEYIQLEMMYKAQIARLNEELRFAHLTNKVVHKAAEQKISRTHSFPNVLRLSGEDENSTDNLILSELRRENTDLARLIVQLKHHINRLASSENELMRKLADNIETIELARRGQTKAEMTCRQLLAELDSSKVRFAAALEEQAERHREDRTQALNQSDNRLQALRTTLLLAEGQVAEAVAKGEHAEQQLADVMRQLENTQAENRTLREEAVKSTQSTQTLIANLNMKAERATSELCQLRSQVSLDENWLQETINGLKMQLRETHDRAEKAETEVVDVTEAHIRLLSRVNSLEQQLHTKERDLENVMRQHEYELREIFETTRAREAQLVSTISTAALEHEERLAQASQLIDQHRSILFKLREACKTGVEVFDVTVTRLDRKQHHLTLAAKAAEEAVNRTEEQRRRLEEETVDHLNQTDHLSKRVWSLEEALRERELQINVFIDKERGHLRDFKILKNEIKFLQQRFLGQFPEESSFMMDRLIHGSPEIRDLFARIG